MDLKEFDFDNSLLVSFSRPLVQGGVPKHLYRCSGGCWPMVSEFANQKFAVSDAEFELNMLQKFNPKICEIPFRHSKLTVWSFWTLSDLAKSKEKR